MHPATGFGIRHPLHTVHTTFKFQCAINIFTYHFNLYFFISTYCSFTFTQ